MILRLPCIPTEGVVLVLVVALVAPPALVTLPMAALVAALGPAAGVAAGVAFVELVVLLLGVGVEAGAGVVLGVFVIRGMRVVPC